MDDPNTWIVFPEQIETAKEILGCASSKRISEKLFWVVAVIMALVMIYTAVHIQHVLDITHHWYVWMMK